MRDKILTAFCIAVSILLIGVGFMKEQHISVLNKAIKICMECVGIG